MLSFDRRLNSKVKISYYYFDGSRGFCDHSKLDLVGVEKGYAKTFFVMNYSKQEVIK